MKTWVLIRDPNCVPVQKGPIPAGRGQLARFLREVFKHRPYSFVTVITLHDHGDISVQDGPECLQMLDGRSMGVGRRHNARLHSRYQALTGR